MVEAQLPWHHCPWMLQPESCSSCSPLLCWGARLSLCREGDTAPTWLWWLTHHRAESIAAAPRSSTGKQMHGQQTNPHWQASASGSAGTPTMNTKETSIFNILGEREKKHLMYLCLSFHLCGVWRVCAVVSVWVLLMFTPKVHGNVQQTVIY